AAEATVGWSRQGSGGCWPTRSFPAGTAFRMGVVCSAICVRGEGPVLGQRLELEALHREGFEFPVELTISARRSGDIELFNAFLHDISDRRRAAMYVDAQQAVTRILAEAETEEDVIAGLLRERGERM